MSNRGFRRNIIRLGCVAASALGFSALVHANAMPTRETVSELREVLGAPAPKAWARPPLASRDRAAAVKAVAPDPLNPLPAPTTTEPVTAPAEGTNVLVPDFAGDRLSRARREAKQLGLRIVARDEYGNRITADAQYYRVRKQRTAAGSELAKGGEVRVVVREIAEYAGGY